LKVGEQINSRTRVCGNHPQLHAGSSVRNLEREIATLRATGARIAEGKTERCRHTRSCSRILACPSSPEKEVEDASSDLAGCRGAGLDARPWGHHFIEATRMRGGKQFTDDGILAKSWQESLTASVDVNPCKRRTLWYRSDFFRKQDIHIHVPPARCQKTCPSRVRRW